MSIRMPFLLVFPVLLFCADAAGASVLCSSHLGHLRLRERCPRHETQVDVAALSAGAFDVPLRNWDVAPRLGATEGLEAVAASAPSNFINLDPCRLVDSRPGTSSAFVGDDIGAFADFEIRTYTLTGLCGVPADATALSINLAVVPGVAAGFASVGPGGSIAPFPPGPSFASISYEAAGPVLSNSLIVPLDASGQVDIYAARAADVVIDTNGYFLPEGAGSRTVFLPGTGTPTENGTALRDLVEVINIAPLGSLWSVELGPGVFDLGSALIGPGRRTAIHGAGRGMTTVTCACAGTVLVAGADGLELYDLRLDNTHGSSTLANIAISSGGNLLLRSVHLTSTSGGGISLNGSTGTIEDTLIETEIASVFAVDDIADAPSLFVARNSVIQTVNADVVVATDSILTIEDSTLDALAATRDTISLLGTTSVATVRHSRLETGGASYLDGAAGTFSMSQSYIDAAATSFGGTATCSATSGPGTFVATGCP